MWDRERAQGERKGAVIYESGPRYKSEGQSALPSVSRGAPRGRPCSVRHRPSRIGDPPWQSSRVGPVSRSRNRLAARLPSAPVPSRPAAVRGPVAVRVWYLSPHPRRRQAAALAARAEARAQAGRRGLGPMPRYRPWRRKAESTQRPRFSATSSLPPVDGFMNEIDREEPFS